MPLIRIPSLLLVLLTLTGLLASDLQLRRDLEQRRQAVMEKMNNRGVLILFSADPQPYSGDVNYEFRQENNFYYLTGIKQPHARLILMPQSSSFREILFLPDADPMRELWSGKMLSPDEATQISGIQKVWSSAEFETFVGTALNGHPTPTSHHHEDEFKEFSNDLEKGEADVFLLLERRPGLQGILPKEFEWANRLRERFIGIRIRDATNILHELRLIKSAYEIKQLRKAIQITAQAHLEAIKTVRPGVWEYEVEAVTEYIFKKSKAFNWAFPSIVASGPNTSVLHYRAGQRQIRDGDLIVIDIGAEYNYYAGDITRTLPVNGKFSPQQAAVYQIVLDAQKAAMALVKPGSSLPKLNHEATEVLKEGLLRIGLIADKFGGQYQAFFPHGIGHWLGLNVHDVGSPSTRFRPGMVLTIEPGIYVREDALQRLSQLGMAQATLKRIRPVLEKYRNIGARIEDDLLVTEKGYELLSKGVPREIHEIEVLMKKD